MKFWTEHGTLRVCLMLCLFAAGIGALLYGLSLTGQLAGLLIMLAGLALLLGVLWLYNKPFTEAG